MTPAEKLDRLGRAAYWAVVLGVVGYVNREAIRRRVRTALDQRAARIAAARDAQLRFTRRLDFLRSTYHVDGGHDQFVFGWNRAKIGDAIERVIDMGEGADDGD